MPDGDQFVTAVERSADFLFDALSEKALNELLSFSEGFDKLNRMNLLKNAICMVADFRLKARDPNRRHQLRAH